MFRFKNRQTIRGNITSLGSGFFWGLSGTFLGLVLSKGEISAIVLAPIILAFINDFTCFIIMFGAFIWKKNKREEMMNVIKGKGKIFMFLAALCGGPIGMTCYLFSIKYIGFAYTACISASYPAFGALLSYQFLKDKLSKIGVLGITIATVCAMILGYIASDSVDSFGLLGAIFAIGCAIGWGLEIVLCAQTMNLKISSEIAYFFRQAFSSLGYIAVLLFIKDSFPVIDIVCQSSHIYTLVMITAVTGLLSYLMYYSGINSIGPVRAMALNITYSAWGCVLSWIILGSKLSIPLLILCILIMIGSFMTTSGPEKILLKIRNFNK